MPSNAFVKLSSGESAALTRLALGFCLGKGSVCLVSRSYSLQVAHPKAELEYINYQWRRICQFLPATSPPRLYVIRRHDREDAGQWRLRVSSRYLETAYHLLYPNGRFRLTSCVLELLGGEAIATLWADRARVLMTKRSNYCLGRLGLTQMTFDEAELIRQWIFSLTGCESTLGHNPRSQEAPMLYFNSLNTIKLIDTLKHTWMATAPCLAKKFRTPPSHVDLSRLDARERLEAAMLQPLPLDRNAPSSLLRRREPGRRAPGTYVPAPVPLGAPELPEVSPEGQSPAS